MNEGDGRQPPVKTPPPAADAGWAVYRTDDNGNEFLMRCGLTRAEAGRIVAEFEARGHKQVYWAERDRE